MGILFAALDCAYAASGCPRSIAQWLDPITQPTYEKNLLYYLKSHYAGSIPTEVHHQASEFLDHVPTSGLTAVSAYGLASGLAAMHSISGAFKSYVLHRMGQHFRLSTVEGEEKLVHVIERFLVQSKEKPEGWVFLKAWLEEQQFRAKPFFREDVAHRLKSYHKNIETGLSEYFGYPKLESDEIILRIMNKWLPYEVLTPGFFLTKDNQEYHLNDQWGVLQFRLYELLDHLFRRYIRSSTVGLGLFVHVDEQNKSVKSDLAKLFLFYETYITNVFLRDVFQGLDEGWIDKTHAQVASAWRENIIDDMSVRHLYGLGGHLLFGVDQAEAVFHQTRLAVLFPDEILEKIKENWIVPSLYELGALGQNNLSVRQRMNQTVPFDGSFFHVE